jgi:hypothetical protein
VARKRSYDRLPFTREFWVSKGKGGGDTPLPVICEDRVRLTECEEFFPGLRFFVHIRVELLAQLQSLKYLYSVSSIFREGAESKDCPICAGLGRRVGAIRTL